MEDDGRVAFSWPKLPSETNASQGDELMASQKATLVRQSPAQKKAERRDKPNKEEKTRLTK